MLLASMALAVLLASGVVLAQRTTPHPTLEQNPAGKIIPGRYIVVLEEGDAEEGRDPTTVAQVHARRHGTEVLHTYEHALTGLRRPHPRQATRGSARR
jgi:hypothetical protein